MKLGTHDLHQFQVCDFFIQAQFTGAELCAFGQALALTAIFYFKWEYLSFSVTAIFV